MGALPKAELSRRFTSPTTRAGSLKKANATSSFAARLSPWPAQTPGIELFQGRYPASFMFIYGENLARCFPPPTMSGCSTRKAKGRARFGDRDIVPLEHSIRDGGKTRPVSGCEREGILGRKPQKQRGHDFLPARRRGFYQQDLQNPRHGSRRHFPRHRAGAGVCRTPGDALDFRPPAFSPTGQLFCGKPRAD